MAMVPGTKVKVSFYTFKGSLPELYYPATNGTLKLASVNAGNADTLCVGLGGVNKGFLDILQLTQKRVNLSPKQLCAPGNYDDYQDRHVTLLKQADSGGSPWASYANTDPCAFSYVNPSRLSSSTGYAGVCFVDVFDPSLAPNGNSLNAAMLYVAPPNDVNYGTAANPRAAFLAAIQATAVNIIKTIAGYNAVAAQQNQPPIEALQNCLYSSGLYHQTLHVSHDDIARAIFAGLTSELVNTPNSGLLELQFPVGDPLASVPRDRFFAAVQGALTAPAPHTVAVVPPRGRGRKPVVTMMGNVAGKAIEGGEGRGREEDPYREWGDRRALRAFGQPFDPANIRVGPSSLQDVCDAVRQATQSLIDLAAGTVHGNAQYDVIPQAPAPVYDQPDSPLLSGANVYDQPNSPLAGDANEYFQVHEPFPEDVELQEVLQESQGQGQGQGQAQAPSAARTAAEATHAAATDTAKALDTARAAQTFRDLKIARDSADAAAKETRTHADAADVAATQSGENEDRVLADAAEDVATKAEQLARNMDIAVKRIDAVREAWRTKRIALTAVLSILAVAAVAATPFLVWLYAYGGARKQPSDGDLDIFAVTGPDPVPVDIFAKNGLDPATDATVSLWVNGAPTTSSGLWSVAKNIITYATPSTPADGTTLPPIQYIIQNNQTSVFQSVPKNLTITFVAQVTDIVKAAVDSKTTVSFTSRYPPQDQFALLLEDSAWISTTDPTTQVTTVVFDPSMATGLLANTPYNLGGLTTDQAQLVVLLPGPTLPGSTNASRTGPSYAQVPMIPASPGPAVWTLIPDPTHPPSTQQLSYGEVQGGATIGNWILAGNSISFNPTTVPNSVAQVTVHFGLLLDGVVSQPGQWTAIFVPPGMPPPPPPMMDLTFVAKNNTDAMFSFTIPASVAGFNLGTVTSGGGTWGMNGGQVEFTPLAGFDTSLPYKSNYTATGVSGNVVVLFPQNISLSNVARYAPIPINFATQLPAITQLDSYSITANPTVDPFGATWMAAPGSTTIQFVPTTDFVLQTASSQTQYTLTFPDRPAATASLTLNFTTTLQAYDITATVTTATPLTIKILDFIYFPGGPVVQDIQLTGGSHTATVNGAVWTYFPNTNPPEITLDISAATDSVFPMTYTVFAGGTQSTGKITAAKVNVMMRMMRAADFLMTMDLKGQTPPAQTGMDVLSASSSFFKMDPASVVLTGMVDVGQDYTHYQEALLETGGKALHVPEEGVWMVVDGKIGFTADKNLSHPPTPVGYRFQDVKGNQSNVGSIVIDPSLTDAFGWPAALGALDDTAFWDAYQKHVSRGTPYVGPGGVAAYHYLDPQVFIAVTSVLAGAIVTLGEVGANPVADEDFEKAYGGWMALPKAQRHWDDPVGTANPQGVFKICGELVKNAPPSVQTKYGARYWRLTLMARMAAASLPPVPTN